MWPHLSLHQNSWGVQLPSSLLTSASLKVCTAKATPGERGRWWHKKQSQVRTCAAWFFLFISLCLRWVWITFVRCFCLHDVRLWKCRNKFMRSKIIVQSFWGAFKKFNHSWRADFLLAFLANSRGKTGSLHHAHLLSSWKKRFQVPKFYQRQEGICVDGYRNHHKVYNTPRKINVEPKHGGLEDDWTFLIA